LTGAILTGNEKSSPLMAEALHWKTNIPLASDDRSNVPGGQYFLMNSDG